MTKESGLGSSGPVLVSACLAGCACRYDGSDNSNPRLLDLLDGNDAVLVCPEEAGGLGTPRPPAEIVGGDGHDVLEGRAKVLTEAGRDVTGEYLEGARRALDSARRTGARTAVLKARSPSCGKGAIYDGSFGGRLSSGDGVTAALLQAHGIRVVSEEELADL